MSGARTLLNHSGSYSSFPNKEQQARARCANIPHRADPGAVRGSATSAREVDRPLGCHRHRVPDNRLVFDELVQALVFGCAYDRISDESCSATTSRRRRDEWIDSGVMKKLREIVLDPYDRIVGLELSDVVAVDCCIQRRPLAGRREGGQGARWIGESGASNAPRSWTPTASRSGL